MKMWKVKWENIFAIITGLILLIMTINFFIKNGFDFNVLMFEIVYAGLTIMALRWSIKLSRKFFLEK